MGRKSFVAWLFIMAAASLLIAIAESSFGWFIGGGVLLSVAVFALRQFKREEEHTERSVSSGTFVGLAFLALIAAMFFLFWLQFSA